MPGDFVLAEFLPYRLAVLSERVSRRLAVEYGRTLGLSTAEWRVLVHLERAGEVSIRDIQGFVNLEKPRVSRAVARLEAAGLVRKSKGEGDRRLVAISLTDAGERALGRILPEARTIEARLKAAIPAAEFAVFSNVLERLHDVLDADPDAAPRPRVAGPALTAE